ARGVFDRPAARKREGKRTHEAVAGADPALHFDMRRPDLNLALGGRDDGAALAESDDSDFGQATLDEFPRKDVCGPVRVSAHQFLRLEMIEANEIGPLHTGSADRWSM